MCISSDARKRTKRSKEEEYEGKYTQPNKTPISNKHKSLKLARYFLDKYYTSHNQLCEIQNLLTRTILPCRAMRCNAMQYDVVWGDAAFQTPM